MGEDEIIDKILNADYAYEDSKAFLYELDIINKVSSVKDTFKPYITRSKQKMTVKELKEILNYFDDSLMILMTSESSPWYKPCTHVAHGINEMDGYVILDDYSEEDN